MKKLTLFLIFIAASTNVQACLDCSGNGGSIAFTGTVTVNNLIVGQSTGFIANQTAPQASSSFNVSSGTIGNFTSGPATFTATINVSSVRWADGTSQNTAVSNTQQVRNFDSVVLGTSGATNTNATVVSQADWIMALSSFGMAGLTTSTTAQGKFFFRNGVYAMDTATNPAGSTVLCESSAVFVLRNAGQRVLMNYGTFGTSEYPCSIDGSSQTFTNSISSLATASKSNLVLYGMQGQGGIVGGKIVSVTNSTGVIANLNFKEWRAVSGVTTVGDTNGFSVISVTGCVFNIKSDTYVPSPNSNGGLLDVRDTWASKFTFDAAAADNAFLTIQGIHESKFLGKMIVPDGASSNGGGGNTGIISIRSSLFLGISSGTYFNIDFTSYDNGNLVYYLLASAAGIQNVGIAGTITEHATNTHTGISIAANVMNTFADSLYFWGVGTPVSDSGTNSILNYWSGGRHIANP